MSTQLGNLITELGRQMGVEGLMLDDRGSASLEVDSVVLNFESDDDGRTLVLFSQVGVPPRREETTPEFYEMLLRANFFHLGTGGFTLGMDRESGMIALVARIPTAGLEVPALLETVERFVNLAEAWTQRIPAALAASGEKTAGGADMEKFLRI